jgi:hypothetical protein
MGWSETIVQKDSYEAEFERMSDEEIITRFHRITH